MEQITYILIGIIGGGAISFLITNFFSSTRTDLRKARYYYQIKKYDLSVEHYKRFFHETKNSSLLWEEIKNIFFRESNKIFDVQCYTTYIPIIAFFDNRKKKDKKYSELIFLLIELYKELTLTDKTWVFELPCLITNDTSGKSVKFIEQIKDSELLKGCEPEYLMFMIEYPEIMLKKLPF